MCIICHPYAKYTSKYKKISHHLSLCTLFFETPLSIYCVSPCKSMISPMTAAFLPWESEPKCLQSSLYYSCRAGGLHALVQRSRMNKVFTLPYLCRICHAKDCCQKCICKKFLTSKVPCQGTIQRKTETLWNTGSRLHKEYENINAVTEQKLSNSSKATTNLCTC